MAIRKRVKYTSKSERHSTSLSILKLIRKNKPIYQVLLEKQISWSKGQNPWLSVVNPNVNETNKKFIRVRSNAYWGSPFAKKEKAA